MAIEVLTDPAAMAAWSEATRARGGRIALVPTMGALHAGHLALVRGARQRASHVVVSIFVNPTQFGPNEDLAKYPRDLPGDLARLESSGADVAFVPEATAMYPAGFDTVVDVPALSRVLCGAHRPGHFAGVATVVLKLLHIVRPHVAVFGEKDFQQLAVVRRMARDLDLPVEIAGCPTVREPDGLAMSSRNAYLSPADRARAASLYRGLATARASFLGGERSAETLLAAARAEIAPAVDRLDYIALCDAETLAPLEAAGPRPAVLLVAVWIGSTRLIDNQRLS